MGSGSELPIFPLSTVVLFPRVQCPLHIFEQRYRDMMEEVMSRDRHIGMVAVPPEHAGDMAGDPPVFPVGCAGVVSEHQRLPDGRYNLVLLGTHRFRILREPPRAAGRLFRVAEVEKLADRYERGDRARVTELRARVLDMASRLIGRGDPKRARRFRAEGFREVADPALVNALSNAFPFPPAEKQALLEADSILARYELLADSLRFHLAAAGSAATSEPGRLH